MNNSSKIHLILKKYWGYTGFRPQQEEIINAVLDHQDVVAILPTGGGKSICYQLPGMIIKGLTVVISPLISLMEDQVSNLKNRGIPAAALHSGIHNKSARLILDNCINGKIKLLYLAPERLISSSFQQTLDHLPIKLLAVDEVHCISQWGHDFRPSYLQIATIKEKFPNLQILALTGTATTKVISEVIEILKLPDPQLFQSSFFRRNLIFKVEQADHKLHMAIEYAKQSSGSFIIYTRSRRSTILIRDELINSNIKAEAYHAGLEYNKRRSIQESWIKEKIKGIVATTAFGMGIDKSNVRMIIHFDIPNSLEEYIQESGRAGRDGNPAHCIILTNPKDEQSVTDRVRVLFPTIEFIKNIYKLLAHYGQVASGSIGEDPINFDLELFCKLYKLPILPTKAAMEQLALNEYIGISNKYSSKSRVLVNDRKEIWNDLELVAPVFKELFQALVRLYEGILQVHTPISELQLAKYLKTNKLKIVDGLRRLEKLELISYQYVGLKENLWFINHRVDSKNILIDEIKYEELKQTKLSQVKAMVDYLRASSCRQKLVGEYFNEKIEDCKACDNCKSKYLIKRSLKTEILSLLNQKVVTLDMLIEHFDISAKKEIIKQIAELEKEELIAIDDLRMVKIL